MDNVGSWNSIKNYLPETVTFFITADDVALINRYFPNLIAFCNSKKYQEGESVCIQADLVSRIKQMDLVRNEPKYEQILIVVADKIMKDVDYHTNTEKLKMVFNKYTKGESNNADSLISMIDYFVDEVAIANGYDIGRKPFFDRCELIFSTPDKGGFKIDAGQVLTDILIYITTQVTGKENYEDLLTGDWKEELKQRYSKPKAMFNLNEYLTIVSRELCSFLNGERLHINIETQSQYPNSILTLVADIFSISNMEVTGKTIEVNTIRGWVTNTNY